MQPQQVDLTIPSPGACLVPRAVPNAMVRDHVVWSLFSFTSCNCCCLGFLAFLFSIKSRDRKAIGDSEGAANYGRTAKYLNIAAVIVTVIIYVIVIIILISSAMFIVNTVFNIMKLPDEVNQFSMK